MSSEKHLVYLSRRNLLTLLAKLDAGLAGEVTARTIIKGDTTHPKYPCSVTTHVTAIEDSEYYTDRQPGQIHPREEATLSASTRSN